MKWLIASLILLAGCASVPDERPANEEPQPEPEQPTTQFQPPVWEHTPEKPNPTYSYDCEDPSQLCATKFTHKLDFPNVAVAPDGTVAITGTTPASPPYASDIEVWIDSDDWLHSPVPSPLGVPADTSYERVGSDIAYDQSGTLHLIFLGANPTGPTFNGGLMFPPFDVAYSEFGTSWSIPKFITETGRADMSHLHYNGTLSILASHSVPGHADLFVKDPEWYMKTSFDDCTSRGGLGSYREFLQIGCVRGTVDERPSGAILYPGGITHMLKPGVFKFPVLFDVERPTMIGYHDGLTVWYVDEDNSTDLGVPGMVRGYQQYGPDLHVLMEDNGIRHVIIRNETIIHNQLFAITGDEPLIAKDMSWGLEVTPTGLFGVATLLGQTFTIEILAT